ncbi:hypothetical protein ACWDOP_14975 [Nocardia sp. NPDC003693]
MAITYTGDPSRLQSSANQTAVCLGELESALQGLAAVNTELQASVVSPNTGMAINNTLSNAWNKGKTLGGTLQQIINELGATGVKIDFEDLEGAARVNAVRGADGAVDAGQWTGTTKVDTASW